MKITSLVVTLAVAAGAVASVYFLADYVQSHYGRAVSTPCEAGETTLWSGAARGSAYSVCAGRAAGVDYVQYRASQAGRITTVYPSAKVPPAGHFVFQANAHDASLSFNAAGRTYTILEPYGDDATLAVAPDGGKITLLTLPRTREALTDKTAIAFFRAAGVTQ